jgi:hypothetical protein
MHHSRLCAVLIDCETPSVVVRVQRPGFPKNAQRGD